MLDKYRLLGFSKFCEPSFIIHLVILVPIKSWKRLASSNDNFGLIKFVVLFTVECPQVDCPSYCPHGRHYGTLANGCPTCECCKYVSIVITIFTVEFITDIKVEYLVWGFKHFVMSRPGECLNFNQAELTRTYIDIRYITTLLLQMNARQHNVRLTVCMAHNTELWIMGAKFVNVVS